MGPIATFLTPHGVGLSNVSKITLKTLLDIVICKNHCPYITSFKLRALSKRYEMKVLATTVIAPSIKKGIVS